MLYSSGATSVMKLGYEKYTIDTKELTNDEHYTASMMTRIICIRIWR